MEAKDFNIRIATIKDLEFLLKNDRHIPLTELKNLINLGRVYVGELENQPITWLRYNLFWDNLPFMNLLYVLEGYQKSGFGKKLVEYWEEEMKKLGHKLVMTSTLSDENAQHFYRKLSYVDSGSLLLKGEALEIIFTKEL